jgi:transcriptional regulator with XRE-family HTH domain
MPIDPAKLKAAREKRRLTQQDLANRTGIHRAAIARLEAGNNPQAMNPKLDKALKLARALRVKVEALCKDP